MARVTVLTGDNQMSIRARRAVLLESSGASADSVARYDLSDPDDLVAFTVALSTIPLFAGPRYLEASPAALLPSQTAVVLARVSGADTVVLHGDKPVPAALIKAAGATVETHKSPAGAGLRTVAATLANEHHLQLRAEQLTRISELCSGDVARLQSLMYSLSVTAQTSPTDEILERYLTGAVAAAGTPWALTDQLGAGHIGSALLIADTVEPLAALSYIATRLGQMGRILEDNLTSPEQAAGAIGLASAPTARALIALATRIGASGLAGSWDVIVRADVAAKSSTSPRGALDLALTQLHHLWSGPGGT